MVPKNAVCFDTNLLIDVLAKRPRYNSVSSTMADSVIYASSYSIGTLHYYAKKYEKINNEEFKKFIDTLIVIPVDATTIDRAFQIAGNNDLEDAIQIASCIQARISVFATVDKKLAKLYSHLLDTELIC